MGACNEEFVKFQMLVNNLRFTFVRLRGITGEVARLLWVVSQFPMCHSTDILPKTEAVAQKTSTTSEVA